jgi:hypothetical protein
MSCVNRMESASRPKASVLSQKYGCYISERNGVGFGRCPTPKTAPFRPNPQGRLMLLAGSANTTEVRLLYESIQSLACEGKIHRS